MLLHFISSILQNPTHMNKVYFPKLGPYEDPIQLCAGEDDTFQVLQQSGLVT